MQIIIDTPSERAGEYLVEVLRQFEREMTSGYWDRNTRWTADERGIVLTREQIESWAGRRLSDEEVDDLENAIPNSSIPDAVATIVPVVDDED